VVGSASGEDGSFSRWCCRDVGHMMRSRLRGRNERTPAAPRLVGSTRDRPAWNPSTTLHHCITVSTSPGRERSSLHHIQPHCNRAEPARHHPRCPTSDFISKRYLRRFLPRARPLCCGVLLLAPAALGAGNGQGGAQIASVLWNLRLRTDGTIDQALRGSMRACAMPCCLLRPSFSPPPRGAERRHRRDAHSAAARARPRLWPERPCAVSQPAAAVNVPQGGTRPRPGWGAAERRAGRRAR
jgi:hypothetical protein